MILDDDAKAAKQRHVEGHTGSSLWEIQHVLLVCMTAYLFWRAVSLRLAPSLSTLPACLLEFAVLVVPFIVAITFTQWTNTVLVAQTAAFAPFSVAFRAYLQLLTVAAILAVDFNVFPRRFAKAETFGTSLMDLGVGAFVFSSGLVSGPRLSSRSQTSSTKLSKTLMIVLPPMIFGLLRTLLTKSVNYQEHVTEYGVHWNFFFTLGIISLLVTLQGIFIPRASFAIVGLTVLLGYQMALARGLQEYILTAPRVDFFSMNREGICSLAGYYCILQFAAQIGAKVLPSEPTADIGRRRFETLGTSFVMLVFGFVVSNQVYGIQANAPYAFWVTAVCVFFVSSFFAIDEALSRMFHADAEVLRRLSAPPVLFDQINRSHLVTFLVANLLTGLVNLTIDTLRVPDLAAFGIVCGYVFTVCMAIVGYRRLRL
nr:Glucosaminyl phosphatidylinositol (GlcN-PI) nositol acylation protein [Polyrhizophydium stewartii]